MGIGVLGTEQVDYDSKTGKLVQDSTWTYKIPSATCVPHQFNVAFLEVSSGHPFFQIIIMPFNSITAGQLSSRVLLVWVQSISRVLSHMLAAWLLTPRSLCIQAHAVHANLPSGAAPQL